MDTAGDSAPEDTSETGDTAGDTGAEAMDLNFGREWDSRFSGCGWSWVFAQDTADGPTGPRTAGLDFHLDLSAIDQASELDFDVVRPLGASDSLQIALPGGDTYFEVRDCTDSGFATYGRVWTAESATVAVVAQFSYEQTSGVYGPYDPPLAVYDAQIDITDVTFVSDDGYTATAAEIGPLFLQLGWRW